MGNCADGFRSNLIIIVPNYTACNNEIHVTGIRVALRTLGNILKTVVQNHNKSDCGGLCLPISLKLAEYLDNDSTYITTQRVIAKLIVRNSYTRKYL